MYLRAQPFRQRNVKASGGGFDKYQNAANQTVTSKEIQKEDNPIIRGLEAEIERLKKNLREEREARKIYSHTTNTKVVRPKEVQQYYCWDCKLYFKAEMEVWIDLFDPDKDKICFCPKCGSKIIERVIYGAQLHLGYDFCRPDIKESP